MLQVARREPRPCRRSDVRCRRTPHADQGAAPRRRACGEAARARAGTGIGIEITLNDPDSDIILGLEAKSRIHTSDLTDVTRIPLEALNEDEEGSYVFVARDGKAEKEFVECGIRSDDMVEVKSGIDEGCLVVWKDSVEITDGMGVKVNN